MIDTVIFRIHNLKSKYDSYSKHVRLLCRGDEGSFRFLADPSGQDSVRDCQYYADTGRVQFLSLRNAVHVPSSNYDISYFENWERDYMELNLSVPKYVFGTNVLQFVDRGQELPCYVWDKFERFVMELFKYLFPFVPDYSDVELNRMDLCFNQLFASKEDALKYLAAQKERHVAFARSDRNRFNDYGATTIQHVTQNYTFKVYHKGTEFRRNDMNKLLKHNPFGYDISLLDGAAERMLRYEITCRKGLMNYVFKQKVKDDMNTSFAKNLYRMHLAKTRDFRNFIQHDLSSRSHRFCLASEWDDLNGSLRKMFSDFTLTFNYELFFSLNEFFMERVKKYQFDSSLSINDVHERIKAHAEAEKARTGKSYDVSSMLVMAVLSQYVDLRDLKPVLPKTTYYRYLGKLKEAGVPVNNALEVHPPPLGYDEYFNELGRYHTEYN